MSSRTLPHWWIELTAWAVGSVLTLGVVTVGLGVISEVAAPQALTPVVHVRETPLAVRPSPPPLAQPDVVIGPAMRQVLGPAPGPEVDAVPARVAAPADRYAFLFGVTHYRAPTHETIGAANDVRLIARQLLQQGWLAQNIRVVVDQDATGAALRDGRAWLAAHSEAGRTFSLLHYSGHVRQLGGPRVALWPVDGDFVPDTEVVRALGQLRGKAWVDVAGCEAAAFIPGLASNDILVTASSAATQKSYEYPLWAMSVWSGLVFHLGIGQGQADADRDGRVTVGETLRFATYYAQAITFSQQPYGRQIPQAAGDPVRGWTLAAPPA